MSCWLLHAGKRTALEPGETVIGRDPGAGLFIDDPSVSRRHARIVVTDGERHARGSRQQEWHPAGGPENRPTPLTDSARIRVGDVALTFRMFPCRTRPRPSSIRSSAAFTSGRCRPRRLTLVRRPGDTDDSIGRGSMASFRSCRSNVMPGRLWCAVSAPVLGRRASGGRRSVGRDAGVRTGLTANPIYGAQFGRPERAVPSRHAMAGPGLVSVRHRKRLLRRHSARRLRGTFRLASPPDRQPHQPRRSVRRQQPVEPGRDVAVRGRLGRRRLGTASRTGSTGSGRPGWRHCAPGRILAVGSRRYLRASPDRSASVSWRRPATTTSRADRVRAGGSRADRRVSSTRDGRLGASLARAGHRSARRPAVRLRVWPLRSEPAGAHRRVERRGALRGVPDMYSGRLGAAISCGGCRVSSSASAAASME